MKCSKFLFLPSNLTSVFFVCVCFLSLTACSEKGQSKEASQVAATVGTSEISIHQINQALTRTTISSGTKEGVQAVRSGALERLIEQQLAVDQATELKLHRVPEVVAKLEGARREVLARAYLERIGQGVIKPTQDEVKAYYNSNPALFSERRTFQLQELRIPQTAGVADDLRKWAEQGRNLEDIAAILKTKNVVFSAGGGVRNAEQVPLDLLPKIHSLKDGQNLMVVQESGAILLRLVGSSDNPVSMTVASAGIEQFLSNQRVSEAVTADIKRLRSATPVTYRGDFVAPSIATVTSTIKINASATPISAEKSGSGAFSPVEPSSLKPDAAQVERGLQGLK